MANSDSEWRRWGETEPYFGVLADPRFRMQGIGENREAFFELGRLTVEERLATAERHFGSFGRRRSLEFGCGVGRLGIPLAANFDEVLGLDISPAMLAEAQINADRMGAANLRLAPSDDVLSQAEGQYDFVLSCMVLQHIPARRGMRIIKRLLDQVGPGGVASLQLCTGRPDRTRRQSEILGAALCSGRTRPFQSSARAALARTAHADEPLSAGRHH